MKRMTKKDAKGITLIALVITIVVLIILAGVVIMLSLGNNGIFNRAKQAKEEYKLAQAREELEIEILNVQTKILEEKARTATLEDLLNTLDKNKYEIVLYYTPIASNETQVLKATYSKVKEISTGIMFIVDSKLVIKDVKLVDKEESLKVNDFDVNIENANGSYLTIDASNAITNDGSKIKLYKYYINNEKVKEQEGNKYTVTNLELGTTYSIKVVVVDKNEKEKSSKIKTYTTDNKQYIFKEGDTCDTITGGFNTLVGANNIIVENTSDNIKVTGNCSNSWGFAGTNRKINVEKFSKLKVDIEDNGNSEGNHFGIFNIAKNKEDAYNTGLRIINAWPIGTSGTPRTVKEIDIEEINEEVYIRIGAYGSGKWMKVYNIWLEK